MQEYVAVYSSPLPPLNAQRSEQAAPLLLWPLIPAASFHSHPGRDTHGRSNPFARGTPLHIKKSYPKRARLCIGGASDNGAAGTYTTRQPSSPSASTTAAAAIPALSTASVLEYAAVREPAAAEEATGSRLQRVLERRPARVSPCPYARCANFPASTTILMACASETCLSCFAVFTTAAVSTGQHASVSGADA